MPSAISVADVCVWHTDVAAAAAGEAGCGRGAGGDERLYDAELS